MQLSDRIKEICYVESKDFFLVKHPDRQKQLGEVFTPTELVLEMIEQFPDEMFEDGRTFLDPTVGNGQFLAALAIIKRELGHREVLSALFGADIMQDNVDECKARLLDIVGDTVANKALVDKNIVCADGLKYDYSFNGTNKSNEEAQFDSLFG